MYAACLDSGSSLVDEVEDRVFAYSKSTLDGRYLKELSFAAALCCKRLSMINSDCPY